MTLHLGVLVAYAALLMAFGLWAGRRSRTAGDFFVAGRRLGPLLLFSTILASNIGAGSPFNAAALGYRDGLSAWWWVGSAGIGSIVLALWIGPHIRRIAARHQLETVGDYLELRYSRGVRAAVAVLLWIGTLAILAGQLLAIGWVLNVVTGMDRWAGCVLGGLVVTVYFTAGGLLTAAWVNVVQLAVLLAGFTVVLPLALVEAGGLGQVMTATADLEGYWNPWQGGGSGWFYLAMLGPSFVVSPGLLQKVYGARDDAAVRTGVGLNAAVLLVFAAGPPLLGMIARAVHPGLANQDLALPVLLMMTVPPVVGALGLAALFSAEVSSADVILFMLATSLSRDLYKRFVRPEAGSAEVLRVARYAAVAGGVLGTVLAVAAESIAGVLAFFYTLLSVSLFVPVIAGLYWRRAGAPEALAAMAGGVSLATLVQLASGGAGFAGLTPAMWGLAGAAFACGGGAILRLRRPRSA
ncbi:MAG: sodium:solute symporter family protein [Acidobacteria bacterium]|nr:sodium:solute symporter family protein [Acidobacteriota bacterium]